MFRDALLGLKALSMRRLMAFIEADWVANVAVATASWAAARLRSLAVIFVTRSVAWLINL